ncbi:hypothetical protein TIFTF001_038775 [Ficus carica]|uniref:Uncharacterized protein n=1 Tax=Ficus carica TaxID=3494 RepID=A0AA88E7V9_FICCA|nr:hypothetical protein TIFTF001_038775 [Ficus carica]
MTSDNTKEKKMTRDNTERPEDIKPDEVTSQAKTEVTFKDVIGITKGEVLLAKIMEEVKISISGAGSDNITKIQKVPGFMLQNEEFKQNFKPRELSIGPIHAADPDLFKKPLKLKLAAYFVKETGESGEETGKRWAALLEEFKTEIKDIQTCFDKEVIESSTCDDDLICLLFLDGCAMLGFMHCFVNRRFKELSISNGQAALIQQDLFLLENQIPFKVLALLMGIGQLNLPTLVVNNLTQRMLLNLVAHEMCLSSSHPNHDPWITSYVNLLDLLVDNEQDVKDLRAANVLRNCLSSDAEVARVINSIGSSCFAPSEDTYAYVKKKIQKHHRRRLAIWTAQVCHAHFSSPWTILALFAAIAILVLTAIQTWCAFQDRDSKRVEHVAVASEPQSSSRECPWEDLSANVFLCF